MNEEFYHKDIFGDVVDVDLGGLEKEPARTTGVIQSGGFNIFSITDAFGRRNKKEAWILYQKALSSGISAEEVFFKLFWQVKSMLIILKTTNIAETDMKPYPYDKAKGFLKNFSKDELEKLSADLVGGYHRTRSGQGGLNTLIEKIFLGL
jgi:hypothetical protein